MRKGKREREGEREQARASERERDKEGAREGKRESVWKVRGVQRGAWHVTESQRAFEGRGGSVFIMSPLGTALGVL